MPTHERCPCYVDATGNPGPHPGLTAAGDVCPDCLGRLWRWSDNVPPTLCPGGDVAHDKAVRILGKDPRLLPCGRENATCPGCGRRRDEIGTVADVVATIATDKKHAAEEAAKDAAAKAKRSTT